MHVYMYKLCAGILCTVGMSSSESSLVVTFELLGAPRVVEVCVYVCVYCQILNSCVCVCVFVRVVCVCVCIAKS